MKPVTVAAIFLLASVSLAHLLRILFGVRVTVADSVIPMWVSGVTLRGEICLESDRRTWNRDEIANRDDSSSRRHVGALLGG
jgi:hypothetical protein